MDSHRLIEEIDLEIARLQQARTLLAGEPAKRGPGRPASPLSRKASTSAPKSTGRKRRLSPEGRKRIADAMRKRWAERRKQQGAR